MDVNNFQPHSHHNLDKKITPFDGHKLLITALGSFLFLIGITTFFQHKYSFISKLPFFSKNVNKDVLAVYDIVPYTQLQSNLKYVFNNSADVLNGMSIRGDVDADGSNFTLGDGTITAANIIYSLTAGDGINITGGQNPTISLETPVATGVTSIENITGAVDLIAGTNISLSTDGNKITINSSGSTTDTNTTYTAGEGLALVDTTFSVDYNGIGLSDLGTSNTTSGASVIGVYSGNFTNIMVASPGTDLQTVLEAIDAELSVSGGGGISAVGNIANGNAFTSGVPGSNLFIANTGWIGLGSGAGRIVWNDAGTDTISFMNANVGIGLSNPSYTLDVAGNIRAGTDIYIGSVALGQTGGASVLGVNSSSITYSSASNIQQVLEDLDSAINNFGVGGSGPWLISGNYAYLNPSLATYLGNNASGGTNKLSGAYFSDGSLVSLGTDNDYRLVFDGNNLLLGNTSNTFLSVGDSGTTGNFNFNNNQFYIRGDGNIGIGITNPVYALDIAGGLRVGGTTVFSTVPSISDNNSVLSLNGGILSSINTGGWDKTTSDDLTTTTIFLGDVSGPYNNLQINPNTVDSTELVNTSVTIGSYGGVGGTAIYVPSFTVDADGRLTAASTTPFIAGTNFESPLTFTNGLTRTGNSIAFGGTLTGNTNLTLGSNNFTMMGSGSVGIGTTSPNYMLDVAGNIRAGTDVYIGSIALGATGGASVVGFNDLNNTLTYVDASTIQNAIEDLDSELLTISSSANLWTDGGSFLFPTNDEELGNSGVGTTGKLYGIYMADNSAITFGTDNDFEIFYDQTNFLIQDGSNAFLAIGDSGTTGNFNFNNNQFYIRGDGKVGIGTTNPQEKFEISNSGEVYAQITNTLSTGAAGINLTSGNAYSIIFTNSQSQNEYGGVNSLNLYGGPNSPIAFLVNDNPAPAMFISTASNVGIGTTAPTAGMTLDVAGNIRAGTDVYIGSIALGATGGARKIGLDPTGITYLAVGDTTVQNAIAKLSTALGTIASGTSVSWTDAGTYLYPTNYASNVSLGNPFGGGSAKLNNIYVDSSKYLVLGQQNNYWLGYNSTATKMELQDAGANVFLSVGDSGTTGNFNFNNNQFYIRGDGNIGINTTSPSERVTVNGGNISHTASGNPVLASSYDTAGTAHATYAKGKYVYVADLANGLLTFDVGNIASPSLVSTFATSGDAWDLTIEGNYAYVGAHSGGLDIIDISNPASPTLVGNYNTSGAAANVYISGKYAYVADGLSGLQIIDISNPASPRLISTYATPDQVIGIYVYGKYAYLGVYGSGLYVVDISNPSSPTLADSYDTTGDSWDVYVSGRYAYVADGLSGLQIIDISNPTNISLIGTYDTGGYSREVIVAGKYAYIADESTGLVVVNVNTAASPTLVGSYDTSSNSYGLFLSGKYAYVADAAGGLVIVDINGLETPALYAGVVQTNHLNITENGNVGNNLYVGNGINVGSGGALISGNISIGASYDLYIGNIALGSTGGASLVGVNTAGFTFSTAPTVQGQLSALNTGIGSTAYTSTNYVTAGTSLGSSIGTLDSAIYNLAIGNSGLWRDTNGATSGGNVYLGDTSSNFAIGGTNSNAPFYVSPVLGASINIGSTAAFTIGNTANDIFTFNTDINSGLDLFSLNVPSGTSNLANLFAIYDNGSPIFTVSQAQIESAVPHVFSAAGDVSIAYDLIFSNETSSNIKSNGPLTIESGEVFENNDLTFRTFGSGNMILETGSSGNLKVAGGSIIGGTYMSLGMTSPLNGLLVEGRVAIGATAPTANMALDVVGNIRAGTDVYVGSIALGRTAGGTKIGINPGELAYVGIGNSTVQDALDDLDAAIGNVLIGSSGLWLDGGNYTYLNTTYTSGNIGNTVPGGANKISGLFLTDTAPVWFGLDNDFKMQFNTTNLSIGDSSNNFLTIADSGTLGTLAVNTDDLYVSGTNSRVGIGTATPLGVLDVRGDIFTDRWLLSATNTGVGSSVYGGGALSHTTANEGWYNTAFGANALYANTTGFMNTAVGQQAGNFNTTGDSNIAIGHQALVFNQSGDHNVALGVIAGYGVLNNSSSDNTLIGYSTGYSLSSSTGRNTLIGSQAGDQITSGTGNIVIGYNIDAPSATGNNQLNIGGLLMGTLGVGATINGNAVLGSSGSSAHTILGTVTAATLYTTTVGVTNRDLFVDNTGVVGYVSSSQRYKEDINYLNDVDWLYNLKPVNYVYKNDPTNGLQYGLIAEEVDKINPLLVSYNDQGLPETVSYSKLITPLLKAVQDQRSTLASLSNDFATLALPEVDSFVNIDEFDNLETEFNKLEATQLSQQEEIIAVQSQVQDLMNRIDLAEPIASEESKIDNLADRVSFLEQMLFGKEASSSAELAELINNTNEYPDGEVLGIQDGKLTVDDLTVTGKTNLFDLGVVGDMSVGQIVVRGNESAINSLALPLQIQSEGTAPIELMAGKVVIDTDGNLTVKEEVTAKKYNVDTSVKESSSIGKDILKAGETEIIIKSTSVTGESNIFLTPTVESDVPLAVVEKIAGKSFKVKIIKKAEEDISFNWWIVN